jgi:damage-control phosphatase, subfamily I
MKAFPECINCINKKVTEVLETFVAEDHRRQQIFKHIEETVKLRTINEETPPSLTQIANDILKREIGTNDLFKKEKESSNSLALSLYPHAEEIVTKSTDRLLAATKLAIAGNLIDYGALSDDDFHVQEIIDDYAHRPFGIDNYSIFVNQLSTPQKILFLGDNSGEIVFDKLLIHQLQLLGHEVTYTVKSQPILNDSLLEDAKITGMTSLTTVIESGSTTPGTLLSEGTEQFNSALAAATMIIAKGQGNLETLSEEGWDTPLFYLLLSKCKWISNDAGINKFDPILLAHENYNSYFSDN